ncbi:energy transducer TonB [Helicobacter sp. MIT 14-3879]|uniref:energy transducer TonB n=1 Tax=Helicobacter sp. MIT 14-3879 TaxID=2040649 RepID=UPI000E1E3EEB|nr:TonB family protein [Helicobacter sp. MIT 14-3879]RDU65592.1 hypothetical protein CQA44_01030 [Helicobacter sp. MIT 14-3879]
MKTLQSKLKLKNKISPLKIGFIISFVLHSSLFAFLFINIKDEKITSMQSKAISISLNNINGTQISATKSKPEKKHRKKKKTKKEIEKIVDENPINDTFQDIEEENSKISDKVLPNETNSNINSTLASSSNLSDTIEILGNDNSLYKTILDIINSNRVYPRMAIVRQLKGNIKLEFILLSNGEVRDIKIIEGSHKFLNEDAMKTIKQTYKEYPKPNKDVKVKLTLSYNLT